MREKWFKKFVTHRCIQISDYFLFTVLLVSIIVIISVNASNFNSAIY